MPINREGFAHARKVLPNDQAVNPRCALQQERPAPGIHQRQLTCEALESRHLLSILTVTNANDSGAGSLRFEISAAVPGDTILFASSLAGQTINITGGILRISKPFTIQGPGAGQLTIDGEDNSKPGYYMDGVFQVDSSVTAIISGLTIAHAFTMEGGGIYNKGNLTVADCVSLIIKLPTGAAVSTSTAATGGR